MVTSITDILNQLQTVSFDESSLSHWCNELVAFYEENDRHSYSEITDYLINNGGLEYANEIIVPKLTHLKDSGQLSPELLPKITKLIDHLNLEIVRIRYINRLVSDSTRNIFIDLNNENSEQVNQSLLQIHEKLQNLQNTSAQLQTASKNVSSTLAETETKLNNMQNESIAILGIFSAVVLSFVGGLAFSTSVLQNIHQASIYRLSFITVIIGLVLFNVIWALMSFIMTFCQRGSLNSLIFKVVNGILVALLGLSIIAYIFQWGAFEQRVTDAVSNLNNSQHTEWTVD